MQQPDNQGSLKFCVRHRNKKVNEIGDQKKLRNDDRIKEKRRAKYSKSLRKISKVY